MGTAKYEVECVSPHARVRFANYEDAVAFANAFRKSFDIPSATINEWVPGRGYLPVNEQPDPCVVVEWTAAEILAREG